MAITFNTKLRKGETKDVVGIVIPDEVIEALGAGKRPPVKVTLGGYTYRSTVARMYDMYMVGLNSEHRANSGLNGDETLDVTLEVDTEPRVTPIPEDLKQALEAAGKFEAFEGLAPSRRKEFVRQVEEAKAADTRLRRIDKVLSSI